MTDNLKILLPSDGSETAMKAAAYAARLALMNPQKKVTLMVVVPTGRELIDGYGKQDELTVSFESTLEDRAGEVLEKTADVFLKEGVPVEKILEKGDPAEVILRYAGQGNYDHIIMGSRGVSELRGAALGSVSHKVINMAPCRVTLVK